jgi:CRP-like cAMP-binding protein
MYVVRDGTVSLRKGGDVIKTLDPGEVFGEMALIDHAPRTATAVAGPGCRVTVIDEASFQQLVKKVPGFALELLRLVVRRLRRELARES